MTERVEEVETELADPGRWGLTLTLMQAWGADGMILRPQGRVTA